MNTTDRRDHSGTSPELAVGAGFDVCPECKKPEDWIWLKFLTSTTPGARGCNYVKRLACAYCAAPKPNTKGSRAEERE